MFCRSKFVVLFSHWKPTTWGSSRLHVTDYFGKSRWFRNDLRGENVLVTCGAGTLGRCLALELVKAKASSVVLWDVDQQGGDNFVGLNRAARWIKSDGGNVVTYVCDLCKKEEIKATAIKTKQDVGEITMVINNAGITTGRSLLDSPDELVERNFKLNLLSHFWVTKTFLPSMIKRNHGHIVTISSIAGHFGFSKHADYCSSKFGNVGFHESLNMELLREGVTGVKTSLVCPHFYKQKEVPKDVDLRFLKCLYPEEVAEKSVQAILDKTPLLILPPFFRLFLIMKWLLPTWFVPALMRLLVRDPTADFVRCPISETVEQKSTNRVNKIPNLVRRI